MSINDDDDNDDNGIRAVNQSVVFVTSINDLFVPDITKIS